MKTCIKCKLEKELSEFYIRKGNLDGYEKLCKKCKNLHTKQIREKDPTYPKRHAEHARRYRENNVEKSKESGKKYRENNREDAKRRTKEYYSIESNKERRRKASATRKRERIKIDPLFALRSIISRSISKSLERSGHKKNCKTTEILDCSFEFFKSYLESKFETWMSWENRGLYNNEFNFGWDIDHIIPLNSAKTEEDIIKLNHYTNLQPLDSKINRYIKINKIL